MQKLNGKSKNIVAENMEKLKTLFPQAFSEGKVQLEVLESLLGEYRETEAERYSFSWNGKAMARREAQKISTGTLRPCPEESVDWQTTQNLYIEGDNLEVLKLLQKSYHNKIKMIYIDPPYNTGKDFVYKDNYHDNLQNYKELTGQTDEEGRRLSTNSDTAGRYHSNWLNMMYPRLKLARNLLKDDGVIFISIDDHEVHNLRKICDEIFGEENSVTCLVWEKKKKGTFLSNSITSIKEYVLVLSKSIQNFDGLIGEIKTAVETYPCINASNKREVITIPKGILSKYRDSNFFLSKGSKISVTTMDLILHSDLVIENNQLKEDLTIEGNWRYTQEKMQEYAVNKELYITQDLYLRRIVHEPREKTLKDLLPRVGTNKNLSYKHFNIKNLFEDGWGSNEDGEEELRLLLETKGTIEYPKPLKLLRKLIASIRDENCIILDFFSGSATTAHAVMKLNSEDAGNRKYIMVQLPEPTDENSEAYKAGYKTISEIGKERIRRAAKKIAEEVEEAKEKRKKEKDENPLFQKMEIKDQSSVSSVNSVVKTLDLGFKVFKLDSSNIKAWDPATQDLELSLHDAITNIKEDRTQNDVLYEILLKMGLDLTVPIEIVESTSSTQIYSIGLGALLVCLADEITLETVEEIGKLKDKLQPETCRVVFKDNGFKDDVVKTNAMQIMKRYGIEEVRSI
jgi:adenine-specific DNA-methyltransferase